MSVKELKCPKCGAPVSKEKYVCGYCGTYYVVEGEVAYTLDSRPATGENLEKYVEQQNMIAQHLEESGGYTRILSEEEFADLAFMARNHLREELGREPTIAELNYRVNQYLVPKKIKKEIEWASDEAFKCGLVIMLVLFIILFISMWLLWNYLQSILYG